MFFSSHVLVSLHSTFTFTHQAFSWLLSTATWNTWVRTVCIQKCRYSWVRHKSQRPNNTCDFQWLCKGDEQGEEKRKWQLRRHVKGFVFLWRQFIASRGERLERIWLSSERVTWAKWIFRLWSECDGPLTGSTLVDSATLGSLCVHLVVLFPPKLSAVVYKPREDVLRCFLKTSQDFEMQTWVRQTPTFLFVNMCFRYLKLTSRRLFALCHLVSKLHFSRV